MRRTSSRPLFATLLFLTAAILVAPAASGQPGDAEKLSIQQWPADAVVVFTETGFRGRFEIFRSDDPRLGDNRIGNDGPSSARVPRGCRLVLFEHYDYLGASVEIREDIDDLARTRLGRREASSLRVECKTPTRPDPDYDSERLIGDRRGALVFAETGFRGRYQFVGRPLADLSRHKIGDEAISSVRLGRGCRLVLFSEINFKGKAAEITGDLPTLRRTPIGPDTASSLLVTCGENEGVTLFADSRFRGHRESIRRDVPDLGRSSFGDDRLGSIRVSPGCRATIYADRGFRGRSFELERDALSLVGLPVGPDSASSIRVTCRGEDPRDDDGELSYGGGVLLYDRSYHRGEGVRVRRDVARLSRLPIGDDRVSSIKVAPGCQARLFRDPDFRGRGVLIDRSVDDLDAIRGIGSNELSSIRVSCQRPRR